MNITIYIYTHMFKNRQRNQGCATVQPAGCTLKFGICMCISRIGVIYYSREIILDVHLVQS